MSQVGSLRTKYSLFIVGYLATHVVSPSITLLLVLSSFVKSITDRNTANSLLSVESLSAHEKDESWNASFASGSTDITASVIAVILLAGSKS